MASEGGDSSRVWGIFSMVSALLAAQAVRRGLNTGWKAATGKKPPSNPADPDVNLREAVAWAALSGVTVGVSRMLAQRKAASYYARSTGHLPPQLAKDDQKA